MYACRVELYIVFVLDFRNLIKCIYYSFQKNILNNLYAVKLMPDVSIFILKICDADTSSIKPQPLFVLVLHKKNLTEQIINISDYN